jgi:hypothetical protein
MGAICRIRPPVGSGTPLWLYVKINTILPASSKTREREKWDQKGPFLTVPAFVPRPMQRSSLSSDGWTHRVVEAHRFTLFQRCLSPHSSMLCIINCYGCCDDEPLLCAVVKFFQGLIVALKEINVAIVPSSFYAPRVSCRVRLPLVACGTSWMTSSP